MGRAVGVVEGSERHGFGHRRQLPELLLRHWREWECQEGAEHDRGQLLLFSPPQSPRFRERRQLTGRRMDSRGYWDLGALKLVQFAAKVPLRERIQNDKNNTKKPGALKGAWVHEGPGGEGLSPPGKSALVNVLPSCDRTLAKSFISKSHHTFHSCAYVLL